MQIPNEQVLEMRRQRGDHDRTQHVAQPLDRVNPAQHSGVLENVGIDPSERLGRTSGKLGR